MREELEIGLEFMTGAGAAPAAASAVAEPAHDDDEGEACRLPGDHPPGEAPAE